MPDNVVCFVPSFYLFVGFQKFSSGFETPCLELSGRWKTHFDGGSGDLGTGGLQGLISQFCFLGAAGQTGNVSFFLA